MIFGSFSFLFFLMVFAEASMSIIRFTFFLRRDIALGVYNWFCSLEKRKKRFKKYERRRRRILESKMKCTQIFFLKFINIWGWTFSENKALMMLSKHMYVIVYILGKKLVMCRFQATIYLEKLMGRKEAINWDCKSHKSFLVIKVALSNYTRYFLKVVLKGRLRKMVKLIEIVCNIFYLLSPLLRKEIVGFCAVFPKINSSPMIKFDFTNLLFFRQIDPQST